MGYRRFDILQTVCALLAMMSRCEDISKLERRCPRLGGPVAFGYCRIAAENQTPCFKIFDCWWERFDVVGYLEQRLPREVFNRLKNTRPPDKTATLVDLIRQAKARIGPGHDDSAEE